jgi:hypothetical protein
MRFEMPDHDRHACAAVYDVVVMEELIRDRANS